MLYMASVIPHMTEYGRQAICKVLIATEYRDYYFIHSPATVPMVYKDYSSFSRSSKDVFLSTLILSSLFMSNTP